MAPAFSTPATLLPLYLVCPLARHGGHEEGSGDEEGGCHEEGCHEGDEGDEGEESEQRDEEGCDERPGHEEGHEEEGNRGGMSEEQWGRFHEAFADRGLPLWLSLQGTPGFFCEAWGRMTTWAICI